MTTTLQEAKGIACARDYVEAKGRFYLAWQIVEQLVEAASKAEQLQKEREELVEWLEERNIHADYDEVLDKLKERHE